MRDGGNVRFGSSPCENVLRCSQPDGTSEKLWRWGPCRTSRGLRTGYRGVPASRIWRPRGCRKRAHRAQGGLSIVLPEFARPGTRFELRQKVIEGDYAYIVWEAETAQNVYELESDTFIVKDGRSWRSRSPLRSCRNDCRAVRSQARHPLAPDPAQRSGSVCA